MKKVFNILLIVLGIGGLALIGIVIFIATAMGKKNDNEFTKIGIEQNVKIIDSIFQVEKLNVNSTYKPLSLNFNGKSIFSIGQKLTEIDSSLSYRIDPNHDYQHCFPIIKDYMTTEDKLSHKIGKHSYINGIVYFSADQYSQRIFNVSGSWGFEVYENDVLDEMKLWLTKEMFPELENKFEFKDKWNYKIETQNQIESFELNKEEDSWVLNYKVYLK